MREDLKQLIRNYLNVNGFDVSKADDLIDEYESEQTFTELKDYENKTNIIYYRQV